MVGAFGVALIAFSLAPLPVQQPVADTLSRTPGPETPRRSPCVACGVGQRCDPATGRCELVERTPIPCVHGSTYDPEEGFCIPDETPRPPTPRVVTTPTPDVRSATPAPDPPSTDEQPTTPDPGNQGDRQRPPPSDG